jgi:3-oxoadipate enol-lactonase
MAAVVDATLQRWFTPAFMEDAEVARTRRRLLDNRPADWNAAWHAIAGHDALSRLPGLDLPAMVVVGERDLGTPVETARALSWAIPASRFEVVEGAPHMLQIECSARFSDLVVDFLTA